MRRIGRRLQVAGFWLSAAIFLLVAACWVRSYWVCDDFSVQRDWRAGGDPWAQDASVSWDTGRALFSWGTAHGAETLGIAAASAILPPKQDAHWTANHADLGDPGRRVVADATKFSSLGDMARRLGITYFEWVDPGFDEAELIVPFRLLAVVPAGAAGSFYLPIWKRRRRKRRLAAGLCQRCGYDLRAHAAGEKCPECGAVVEGGMAVGGEKRGAKAAG